MNASELLKQTEVFYALLLFRCGELLLFNKMVEGGPGLNCEGVSRQMGEVQGKEHFQVFEESEDLLESILGKGIGVSGSALSGLAVFTDENIRQLRQEQPHVPLILIRQDTVPEDIREISMTDGLLTARGGQTSHASVVATRLEKTCVVGCRDLQVVETGEYARINGCRIGFGDPISIDGRSGLLLKGVHKVREEVHILPL